MLGKILAGAAIGAALVASAASAQGQDREQTSCAVPVPAQGTLAPWNSPTDLRAAAREAGATSAPLIVGHAVRLALLRTPEVRYALRPEKPGGSVSYGGLVRLIVPDPGSYRVALGSAAWIDLVRGGKAVVSSSHGHGPDCTGIRKMVDFVLAPGRYTLQVAASGEPQTTLLVVRLP